MNIPIKNRIKIKSLFSGLGRKFIIYFVFFSIIPIIFISLLGYNISEKIVIDQNLRYLDLQNKLIEHRITEFFRDIQYKISPQNPDNFSTYKKFQKNSYSSEDGNFENKELIKSFFKQKLRHNSEISQLAILNTSGEIQYATDSTVYKIEHLLKKKILNSNLVTLIDKKPDISQEPLFLVHTPVQYDRSLNRNYIIGIINNQDIVNILATVCEKEHVSNIYILNSESEVLFTAGHPSIAMDDTLWRQPDIKREKNFVYSKGGKRILRDSNRLSNNDIYIVTDVNYNTAMADLITLRNQAMWGVGALIIVLIGIAFYVSQRIIIPIRQLVYTAQDIGDGLLDTPIKIKSKDEIGLLAKELDNMRVNLLDYYENLEKKVQKRSEDLKLAQYQIMHQEKMASIGLLAAGIAHEIGNPLTSISSLTQLLNRRLNDETNLKYLSTIMANIDRISKIVRELVDFSRPSDYESRLTNVNDVAQAAIGIVKYDKRSKNINIHTELDSQLPKTVLVTDQLLQVFINILFNAVDAMEGYGNDLTLKTYHQDNTIIIEIKDTGYGIEENEINKIFEPFYTTKDVGKGTGLGLSVSYGIVRNFSGDISVQSKVGEGSSFTIKLPVQNEKTE